MDKIKQYEKFDKIFWTTGQVPTVPPSEYISVGDWLPTDIAKGQVVLNVADQKIWSRGDTGIFEISGVGSSGATEQWVTNNFLSGDTVLTTYLSGLSDVTISSVVEDNTLIYDGAEWVNTAITFLYTTDTNTGDTYIYTTTQSNDYFLSANTSLSGLTNVTISSPVSEQVLRYNGSIWVNSGISDVVGASELWVTTNFLSGDTTITDLDGYTTTEVNDFFLSANTQLITSLSALTDVSVASRLDEDVLVYDGSDWVNTAVTWVVVNAPEIGDIIYYDGTNWINRSEDVVLYTTASTYTLIDPSVSDYAITIKNIHTGTTDVLPYLTETIDGLTGQTLQQWDAIKVKSDGTNWFII